MNRTKVFGGSADPYFLEAEDRGSIGLDADAA